MPASSRDLLVGLFEYIGEQLKNVDPRGFNISKLSSFRRMPADIAGLPGIDTDIRLEGDHIWLRIARLEAAIPPKPSADISSIITNDSNPFGDGPRLNEAAILRQISEKSAITDVDQHESIEHDVRQSADESLKSFTPLWKSWAESEKPRRKTISLYADLFALKHQMEAEETSKPVELVWGIGVATWRMVYKGEPFDFQYPLLSQAVEVSLDENSMTLEVRPRATDTNSELDAFVACSVTGAANVEKNVREHLTRHADRPVSPFDPASYEDVLKLVAVNLDSNGSYHEVRAPQFSAPTPGDHLQVTDGWVLLSRPRTNNYLVSDLERLQQVLRQGCDVPAGPLALVSPPSDEPVEFEAINFRGLSSRGDGNNGEAKELYFPLPYNSEQVTIVQRLERASGVAVQGPPGTGKTHTIANIICHYLATGRRVLVTSRGEPALKVLQSKIPDEIRPLTVALLTNDREGVRQFQGSIEAIQHRVSQLNPETTRDEIKTLVQAIDRAHSELSQIDRRIDEIAIDQLSEIEVDGLPMRAQKMAELVVSGDELFDWFNDRLSLRPEHAPPFTEQEASLLRQARRTLGSDIVYAEVKVASADQLALPKDIGELHTILCRLNQLDADERDGKLLPLKTMTEDVLNAGRQLLETIEEAKLILESLEAPETEWSVKLRAKCHQLNYQTELDALRALFQEIDVLVACRAAYLQRPVEIVDAALNSAKTREAIARAAQTGKPFGLVAIGQGEAKQHLATIKVAGLAPSTIDDWNHILEYLSLHDRLVSFSVRWNQFADILEVPKIPSSITALRSIEAIAQAAKRAYYLGAELDHRITTMAEATFDRPPYRELRGNSADLEKVRAGLRVQLSRVDLAIATTNLGILRSNFVGCSGPITHQFQSFIDHDLGNRTMETSRVVARYSEMIVELRRVAGLSNELTTVSDLSRRIADYGAEKLAARVRTSPVENAGDDLTFPINWRQAWNWARVKSHLDLIEARDELRSIATRRRDLEEGLSRLYKEMVSKAAWLATKRNATKKVLQALAGYATAIRRIGQGTGPNAVRYRRDARTAMLDASGAVPCWIMSHAKISESMPPEIGAFDLVIVDEASQSDLWALPAIVRGKKILVVGDDKQVSPDGGFIAAQRIDELRNRFLSEQPYGVEMTPEKSLYDLAARVFAAEQVMLREHFRCVPPIIAYSNRTFYKGGIQPLRIPKASERIDPPLVDIEVTQGIRDRHDCNHSEAEAIVDEITAILADERFKGRTIGVVSLLGMEQAKYIDSQVRNRCSAIELMTRRFECGDARTFQGSERDIMFLSMVVDPDNCRALSGNMFEQRFNVAASRARDRMYLVRSVSGFHLSERDLRLTLLKHFDKPIVVDEAETALLIERCESGFERDVFTELTKRGYRVIPQVKTGAYRLDMVVEGESDSRLAIECDGDDYHGPERWQHDMMRQRVLERAGWTFWRCFASTWHLRKPEIMNELIETLTAMGIEPIGSLDCAPTLVEKRKYKIKELEPKDQDVQILVID